jgi:CHAT domain-containing protein
MLAERDIKFAEDLPPDIALERAATDEQFSQVQAALSRSKMGMGSAEQRELRVRLQTLIERREDVKRRVRQASPRLAALRYPEPLSAEEARRTLSPDAAMLSFMIGERETLLFLVRPSAETASALTVLRLPLGAAELDRKVTRLVELIETQASPTSIAAVSNGLYRSLFSQAEPLLARTKRLVLVPDGALHKLPFAALARRIAQDRPLYLIERWAIHSVISATVYAQLLKSRETDDSRGIVAFGDPLYPHLESGEAEQVALSNLRSAIQTSSRLAPLPHTRTEVESIATLYPNQSTVFLGASATEERARLHAHTARYLHFACHGVLDEEIPINSGLVLTVPIDPVEGEHDGVFQAWEIIEKLRLDAEIVTLSACETGLGANLGGEGLVGLTRAFQYAGARSVLASLWSVSDESTADLMRAFYTRLRSGMPKDEALQAAQIDALRSPRAPTGQGSRAIGSTRSVASTSGGHPFRWASFELFGDWR